MAGPQQPTLRDDVGSRPVPDPTILTTEQIDKAVARLRELIESRLDGMEHVSTTRHDALDEAVKLARAEVDKQPAATDVKVQHLKELLNEKFYGVEKQFNERDVRVRDVAASGAAALSAALQAAKEAVGEANKSFSLSIDKSEKATLEQINQQRIALESRTKAIDDQIGDMKDRLTRTESDQRAAAIALGTAVAEKGERRGQGNWSTGILIAVGMSFITLAMTLILFFAGKH